MVPVTKVINLGHIVFLLCCWSLKFLRTNSTIKKRYDPVFPISWHFLLFVCKLQGKKISLNTIAKYFFPSLNVQSKNTFKKNQFRTYEQLEYIAALPRTNKSITFHQQMLVFLANEEKRIKSNFKLKRYEIKKTYHILSKLTIIIGAKKLSTKELGNKCSIMTHCKGS